MTTLSIIAIAAMLLAWLVMPKTVIVTRIVDGDSLEVRRGKKRIRIRIAGLDAPEYRQPGGRASLRELERLITGQTIRICLGRTDRYGRLATVCLVGWTPIHWEMIKAGQAWPCSFLGQLLSIPARLCRRGLWGDPNRMHPDRWRRLYASQHPGVSLD